MKQAIENPQGHDFRVCEVVGVGSLLLFCRKCGCHAEKVPRGVLDPCWGALSGQLNRLRAILNRQHPADPRHVLLGPARAPFVRAHVQEGGRHIMQDHPVEQAPQEHGHNLAGNAVSNMDDPDGDCIDEPSDLEEGM